MPTSSGGGGISSYSRTTSRSTGRPLPAGPGPLDAHGNRLLSKRSTSLGSPISSPNYSTRYQNSTLYGGSGGMTVSQRTKQMLNTNYTDYPSSKSTRGYADVDTNNNYGSSTRSQNSYTNNRGSDYIYNTPSSKAYGSHYEREKYDPPKYDSSRYTSGSSSLTNKYGSSDRLSNHSIKPSYTGSHHGSVSKLSSRSNSVDSIKSNSTPTRRERESVATQNRNDSCSSYDPDTAVVGGFIIRRIRPMSHFYRSFWMICKKQSILCERFLSHLTNLPLLYPV